MSSVYRVAAFSKLLSRCASSSNCHKLLPTVCYVNNANHKIHVVKFSVPLSRSYSTKSDQNKAAADKKDESECEIVYMGQQNKNIKNIKMISLSTSLMGLSVQPIVYQKAVLSGEVTNFTLPIFALLGLFALATPPLLNLITKRYILSIEYYPKRDKYVASVYTLFARQKKIEFTPDDVTIPTVLGMFTNCCIKGKPMFMDSTSFSEENQKHYVRIMGYDQPLDLKLDETIPDTKKSSEKT
ncbi:hypothetical protein TKK_0014218 [Trichogramma kaykai]|uniref:Transmembrane protein 70 n=1 Tax=Trichogramma kaykai TaxID=54128 RepID=A0ABD2WEJ9_9HYME